MNRKSRREGACQELQTSCVGLLPPQNVSPQSQPFLSKGEVQADGLELVSGTSRVGQVGPWLEESLGNKEAPGKQRSPWLSAASQASNLPHNSGLSMQAVVHHSLP